MSALKRSALRSASSCGSSALRLGGVGDRLAVLVGAREEEDVLAALAVVARHDVGGDRRVRVPEVRRRVDVVDRRRDVEGGHCRGHATSVDRIGCRAATRAGARSSRGRGRRAARAAAAAPVHEAARAARRRRAARAPAQARPGTPAARRAARPGAARARVRGARRPARRPPHDGAQRTARRAPPAARGRRAAAHRRRRRAEQAERVDVAEARRGAARPEAQPPGGPTRRAGRRAATTRARGGRRHGRGPRWVATRAPQRTVTPSPPRPGTGPANVTRPGARRAHGAPRRGRDVDPAPLRRPRTGRARRSANARHDVAVRAASATLPSGGAPPRRGSTGAPAAGARAARGRRRSTARPWRRHARDVGARRPVSRRLRAIVADVAHCSGAVSAPVQRVRARARQLGDDAGRRPRLARPRRRAGAARRRRGLELRGLGRRAADDEHDLAARTSSSA